MNNLSSQEALNKLVLQFQGTPQALIIDSYLIEKDKWNNKLKELEKNIITANTYLEKLRLEEYRLVNKINKLNIKQSQSIISKLFGKNRMTDLVKAKSIVETDLKATTKDLNFLKQKYEKLSNSPPDTLMYEIAMFDNSLFKAHRWTSMSF